jgi:hypothetical protein
VTGILAHPLSLDRRIQTSDRLSLPICRSKESEFRFSPRSPQLCGEMEAITKPILLDAEGLYGKMN